MTTLTQSRLDRFRQQRQNFYTAVAEAANELHAANGCSYCRPHSYEAWRPHKAKRFSYEDVRFDESSFVLEIRDHYDGRDTEHFLELPDAMLTDPTAFASKLAAAKAEYAAAEAAATDAEQAKVTSRERDERSTLRRLAARYPEELAAGAPREDAL